MASGTWSLYGMTKGENSLRYLLKKKAITEFKLDMSTDDKKKDDKDKKPEEFTGYSQNTNRVDYAATIEDAYDDLHKMIGEGGIKSLTADTKKLMNQQLELADAMKNMGPLMDQAKSMMDGFDFKNMGDMSSLMKTFNPNSNE